MRADHGLVSCRRVVSCPGSGRPTSHGINQQSQDPAWASRAWRWGLEPAFKNTPSEVPNAQTRLQNWCRSPPSSPSPPTVSSYQDPTPTWSSWGHIVTSLPSFSSPVNTLMLLPGLRRWSSPHPGIHSSFSPLTLTSAPVPHSFSQTHRSAGPSRLCSRGPCTFCTSPSPRTWMQWSLSALT